MRKTITKQEMIFESNFNYKKRDEKPVRDNLCWLISKPLFKAERIRPIHTVSYMNTQSHIYKTLCNIVTKRI